MRHAALCGAFLCWAVALPAADPTPTPEEQQAIDAITKLGGRAEIDPELTPEARVSARFDAMTDKQFTQLKKMSRLGALTTGECRKTTDRGFGQLASLPHLQKLTLSQSAATGNTANALAQCKDLRVLYLGDARMTDAGLMALRRLGKLEVLDLSNNVGITDRGMAHLAAMPRLEQLYLGGTSITDKGLEQLRPLEGLMRLNVVNTKVTTAAAEKFEREMPNLRQVRR